MSQSFDLFVLVTSVPSKIWILLKYSLYNIQTFIEKYCLFDLSLYRPFSKNTL